MIALALADAAAVERTEALLSDPMQILAVFLGFLALLFAANRHPKTNKIFKWIPLLVWAYFVPTVFSNLGVIPLKSEFYTFISNYLLPSSLMLLILSVDIPGIIRLGKPAVILFLTGTLGIVVGGPLAYLILGWCVPTELGDQAWRGLSALAGSWIGGGANFQAIGKSVEANESTMAAIVVVDVAVANAWMFCLLLFADRQHAIDKKTGADRTRLDEVRKKVESYQAEVQRPTNLPDLLLILAIAFIFTVVATHFAGKLPEVGNIIGKFTWVVLIVTAAATALSFTPLRKLDGAGATAVGSVFLYLLVASIGAKAEFSKVMENPALVAIGVLWMSFHVALLFLAQKIIKAPIFFLAVGSKANVGGAASAPVVAHAFHPSLAPVGVLLAVGGYVLGSTAGLLCAALLEQVYKLYS